MREFGLTLLLISSVAHAGIKVEQSIATTPQTNLLYTSQTGPQSDYTITGFPNCTEPVALLEYQADGETWVSADSTKKDGSFKLVVPYASVMKNVYIRTRDRLGNISNSAMMRTDHPLTGGLWLPPNERGWVNLVAASTDLDKHTEEWLGSHDPVKIQTRMQRVNRWLEQQGLSIDDIREDVSILPDSLKTPDTIIITGKQPEDLIAYGFAPAGDLATCIIGATQKTFTAPIDSNGHFAITIPHKAINLLDNGLPSFIINITDAKNNLLSTQPWGRLAGVMPEWVNERAEKDYYSRIESLVGQQFPDLELAAIQDASFFSPINEENQLTILEFWATWCGPCLGQMKQLERIVDESEPATAQLILVSIDEGSLVVEKFLEKRNLKKTRIRLDKNGSEIKDFLREQIGTERIGVPMTFVLNPDGTIRFVKSGVMSDNELNSFMN